ncbi:stress-related protein-like [Rutidosis leptorrhynchoides]|uniref:stress-related protein-like n=1 Tax=Rutidosis leptorrhynchoides TaxID=125765 RepID=UPI003A9998E7
MAESQPRQQPKTESSDHKALKYLDFVQVAAIYFVICFSTIYEYAKDNSGPLKLGVQTVEGSVKTVIGPVLDKFHDVPFQLLKFVDHKVDECLSEVDRHVPSLVKQATSQARAVAMEVQRAGVVDGTMSITKCIYNNYEPFAKELYCRYEPVAEQYAVMAWRGLNRLPIFPQVAEILVPTAAHWSEKYNQAVCSAGGSGYTVAEYLPLIPMEKIAKVFDEGQSEMGMSVNGETYNGYS